MGGDPIDSLFSGRLSMQVPAVRFLGCNHYHLTCTSISRDHLYPMKHKHSKEYAPFCVAYFIKDALYLPVKFAPTCEA